MKKRLAAVLLILAGSCHSVYAESKRIDNELEKLEPEERLEQRCDIEALSRIDAARKDMSPDKVIAYTFGAPKVKGTTIDAKGAVFRSHEHWYRLSYHCEADPTELNIKKFSFKIGAEVPRAKWTHYYLYP
ncbi:DUF930 domain-containing protein [Martelella alba]|uniref:DUF930 domain-containing protein n=1 Tax=Martelella alba TaxID=2590451 RepID=A0A506UFA3_9HYPH|nr:DUF930 domain-containing protein [Martelella alba]TPW31625.1 DUF930 domain-containing protein [Martelella alba]